MLGLNLTTIDYCNWVLSSTPYPPTIMSTHSGLQYLRLVIIPTPVSSVCIVCVCHAKFTSHFSEPAACSCSIRIYCRRNLSMALQQSAGFIIIIAYHDWLLNDTSAAKPHLQGSDRACQSQTLSMTVTVTSQNLNCAINRHIVGLLLELEETGNVELTDSKALRYEQWCVAWINRHLFSMRKP